MGNKYFIDHCQGWKEALSVCETVWFFSWVNTHLFDLTFVTFCPKFSGDYYMEFQEKTISEIFSEIFVQTKAIFYQNLCEIPPYFLEFLFCVPIALKTFTQVLTYVACTQVRRHIYKRITKIKIGGRRASSSCFRKTSFWSEIFTRRSSLCLLGFGYDFNPRFVPQDWQ